MQVMDIGQQLFLKKLMAKGIFLPYKSGAFKPSELHYHSTFKEILAVKHGIENFQFHLLGHNFLVEMDMSSFPKMLQFKRKMLPYPQLLKWSN